MFTSYILLTISVFATNCLIAVASPKAIRNVLPETCGTAVKNDFLNSEPKTAQLGEFPWIVRLQYTNKKGEPRYGCSGFIIHEKYILTAAQCVSPRVLKNVGPLSKIVVGEHDDSSDPDCIQGTCAPKVQLFDLKEPIMHPDYNEKAHTNDIAIIPLVNAINFNEYVSPICLPDANSLIDAKSYTFSGWGKLKSANRYSSTKLKIHETLQTLEECQNKYKRLNVDITELHVCAGGEDTCASQSGGPLMYLSGGKWYASGITSFGSTCSAINIPTVYTNITKYTDWILNMIKQN